MLFLASVGLASGPAFAATAFTLTGVQAVVLAAVVSVAGCGSFLLFAWLLGQSPARAAGGVSGLLGQPAVLQYALSRSTDGRIMAGYATTFAGRAALQDHRGAVHVLRTRQVGLPADRDSAGPRP